MEAFLTTLTRMSCSCVYLNKLIPMSKNNISSNKRMNMVQAFKTNNISYNQYRTMYMYIYPLHLDLSVLLWSVSDKKQIILFPSYTMSCNNMLNIELEVPDPDPIKVYVSFLIKRRHCIKNSIDHQLITEYNDFQYNVCRSITYRKLRSSFLSLMTTLCSTAEEHSHNTDMKLEATKYN